MNLATFLRRTACASAVLLWSLLGSCAYPGGHPGYQTRGYTTRGQHYQPMSIDSALDFKETGVCSWYNESSWFGLLRGTTSLGEKVMPWHLTGAHKTLPLPCMVKVTNRIKGGRFLGVFVMGALSALIISPCTMFNSWETWVVSPLLRVLSNNALA